MDLSVIGLAQPYVIVGHEPEAIGAVEIQAEALAGRRLCQLVGRGVDVEAPCRRVLNLQVSIQLKAQGVAIH